LPPPACILVLDPVEAVEQLPEAVLGIGFDTESRQGAQKTRHRLGTELAPDFGGEPFSYALYGAPVVGAEVAGSRSSVYRFHLDSPIPFAKSFKATIEHGHANVRSDNFYSVAYWYQGEPHAPFPALPPVDARLPVLVPVGGPGSTNPGK